MEAWRIPIRLRKRMRSQFIQLSPGEAADLLLLVADMCKLWLKSLDTFGSENFRSAIPTIAVP